VETQQCAKLTGTNRPFGLTIKLSQLVAVRRRIQNIECKRRIPKMLGKWAKKRLSQIVLFDLTEIVRICGNAS